jgi:N-acetylmuramoyl-L-alanine amidase
MQIRNGRLAGARFLAANSSGGPMTPSLIVLHDTAGRLDKGSSVDWFRSKACTTSAHVVVERDGSITQMVRFDRKAFHAGKSVWNGRRFCNAFSIGIEIVSPGKLDSGGRAWFGPATTDLTTRKATPEHGDGWWLPYTDAQITAVKQLCRDIVAAYPDCNHIVTHWMISPGRKIDPSPLFPLEDVRAFAFGDTDPETADVPAAPVKAADAAPAGMAASTEGNTAVVLGAGGSVNTATEVATAMAKVAGAGEGFSLTAFLMALASSPTFWVGVITVGGAAYIWLRRRARLITHGV